VKGAAGVALYFWSQYYSFLNIFPAARRRGGARASPMYLIEENVSMIITSRNVTGNDYYYQKNLDECNFSGYPKRTKYYFTALFAYTN
jgi:hypothetical protein